MFIREWVVKGEGEENFGLYSPYFYSRWQFMKFNGKLVMGILKPMGKQGKFAYRTHPTTRGRRARPQAERGLRVSRFVHNKIQENVNTLICTLSVGSVLVVLHSISKCSPSWQVKLSLKEKLILSNQHALFLISYLKSLYCLVSDNVRAVPMSSGVHIS